MAALSVCFIGTGAINRRHLHIVRRLRPSAKLAVASRSLERAQAFGHRHGLDEAFGSWEAAVQSNYQILVIGVPPSGHAPLVQQALPTGKHLLIEKPVVNSMDELCQLWPALKSHRGTIMVAENLHFSPFQRLLRRVIDQSDLGSPLFLEMTKLGGSRPAGWRADPAEMPLGALHEGGVHWVRRLLGLAGAFDDDYAAGIVGVRAYGPDQPLTATPHEDTTVVIAQHRAGFMSRLLHSWALPWRFPPFDASKLLCEHGAIYFDARGLYARVYQRRGRRWLWPRVVDAGGYKAMWRHFLHCVETATPPDLTLETVFGDFAYVDAAYRSRQSGHEEALRPLPKVPPPPHR